MSSIGSCLSAADRVLRSFRVSLDAFVSALGEAPCASDDERARLAEALTRALARAEAACVGFAVDPAESCALMAEIVRTAPGARSDTDALCAAVMQLPAEDLALAIGCAHGNPHAMRRFTELHLRGVAGLARRVGGFEVDTDEVLSRVREKLFVAPPDGRPRILDLVGRGSLAGLVRVIAVRTTLNLGRGERREITDPEHALATAIASQTDPELAAIKVHHRESVKTAIQSAIASLDPDERNLLRLSLLHRLTIDEIASLQKVHRATAARRLARIREQLGKESRRRLRAELGPGDPELERVFELVQSSLHVSFERLLQG